MHPCALHGGLGALQGRKRSVLCVCCCDCDRGAVLVVCVVVVVLWCARWSSLALIGVQKHQGVLVCRRGHRKHDNDPQSGGTGEGKYRQNKRQRKFLTSAGFPSVWCLSGVPEGLLIAGVQWTSTQRREEVELTSISQRRGGRDAATVCPLCLAQAPQENVRTTQGRPQSTPGHRPASFLPFESRSCPISSDFTSLLHAETTKYNA